jgi:hypothetical protein
MVRCHDIVSDDVGQSIRELSGVTVTYVQDLEPNRSIGDTDRPVFPDLVKGLQHVVDFVRIANEEVVAVEKIDLCTFSIPTRSQCEIPVGAA